MANLTHSRGSIRLTQALRDERGVAATEYAIMLAVLVLGIMGIVGSIGQKFHVLYTMLANAVGGVA